MNYKFKIGWFVLLIFFILINIPNNLLAKSFNEDIRKVRAEINRDNLEESIKLLGKISITSDIEKDEINLLFGDIYLKINKPQKAEEFYEKSFMTTNERIESLTFIGLAEVKLRQGQIDKAIDFAERSIAINSDFIRPKIILADAKTRIGETDEALDVLKDLYLNNKDSAEVNIAIAGYYSSFDDANSAIEILEKYLKSDPTNIKVMNQLGNLHWQIGNKDKALELKSKVLKHYEFSKNKYQAKKIKQWILTVDPNYFKKKQTKGIKPKQSKEYEEKEIDTYEENKIIPHFEDFEFASNAGGSGFVIGDGKYVITNIHVIYKAKKIAVRNGVGKVSNARVYDISKKYDLALLELEKPFSKEFSIDEKNFIDPRAGEDVLIIGYPAAGETFDFPTITEGIISKVFHGEGDGIFLTSATVNPGNSGGPVINLNGKLVGTIFAATDIKKVAEHTGIIETAMGYGISSNKINEIFSYKKNIPVKKANYSKSAIYEKMLPSVVNVVVLKDLEE
jgi:tetratricopeptide (TPR) repeat protein|tara:strand:+ start:2392 stop:3915 length:1524 start_codon:yes stop_codon:yes gene_type:complete